MSNLQKQPKNPPSTIDYVTKSVAQIARIAFDAGQETVDRTHDLLSQVTKVREKLLITWVVIGLCGG